MSGAAISTPRKRPRQQRSRETYEAVLDAAAELFARHGYAAATTNKIAERAGVSIGSLYQYFPDKDALLYALGERHLARAVEGLGELFGRLRAERPGLEATVRVLVEAVAAWHAADPEMHRLLYDQAPRPPEAAAELRRLQGAVAAEVEHHLRRLGAGGPDPGLTALLLVQGVEAQIHGAVLDPPPGRSAGEVVQAAAALWIRALR
ncbi:TetR/AcrR family transcriptional regulator [Actinomadura viridis]|uniref:AcrR family transcriptional regulator n=1 Tax=Actinomadura viridis TaxID=58110 RepID=A0A931DJF7_9ACTN|nr:TetR/AcrR family transcriptional regulator [Actinomadura viridis]MBG6089698.1 AcrR family transcriptional regulator [Actinomadura viridis]